jgi:hypothetical protein
MTYAVGFLNVLLGLAYTTYGFITLSDMKRGWRSMGFSHFGAAWVAMAFTCGPHHLVHGTHLLLEGRAGGPLDLAAVLVGLPAGATFLYLRVEAWMGGRGDRFIAGSPLWVQSLPTLGGVYLTALAFGVTTAGLTGLVPREVIPNLMLVVLYFTIGYFVLRTQLRNRTLLNGWSVSGLALGIVFPTCGLMHGIYAYYASTGVYHDIDFHGWVVDALAVPAAIYFLWVVVGLYRLTLRDWNREMMDAVPDRGAAVVAW